MKKLHVTTAFIAAVIIAVVSVSCSKNDKDGKENLTIKETPIKWVGTKDSRPYTECASWMYFTPDGDTICEQYYPINSDFPVPCWIIISMDPNDPCFDSPVIVDMLIEIGIDEQGNNWLRKLRFNTLSPMDSALRQCLSNAVRTGSIYIHSGIELYTDPSCPVVNDLLPSGYYTVQEANDTIDIVIM